MLEYSCVFKHNLWIEKKLFKDLKRQDRTFVSSIRDQLRKDGINKKSLGNLVFEHMRKTVKTRVQAIKVNPAPLSRTRSLNDAVIEDCSSTSTSAKSTISRKSEPDMRYWGTNGYEDLWDSTEKPERVVSIDA
ncbi:hypothetical protein KUTeg_020855 [Tegillarca granosa]|uniref:Uncharacterized protein n=1 Tax=Tegillarca granosa TaxID=220873 RepID=A0ABQ9E946_TEGGR|nr:hypothetical protein KUTeg_020855 [Tegillarca granosa]